MILTTTILGAFLYRCRGGFFPTGNTQIARFIYWVLPIAGLMSIADVHIGWACGVMAFAGLMIPHGAYENDAKLKSVLGMAVIGLIRLSLILAPFGCFHPMAFAVLPLGLLQGFSEYAGYTWLDGKEVNTSFGVFAKGGGEWEEVITGAVFGLALGIAATI